MDTATALCHSDGMSCFFQAWGTTAALVPWGSSDITCRDSIRTLFSSWFADFTELGGAWRWTQQLVVQVEARTQVFLMGCSLLGRWKAVTVAPWWFQASHSSSSCLAYLKGSLKKLACSFRFRLLCLRIRSALQSLDSLCLTFSHKAFMSSFFAFVFFLQSYCRSWGCLRTRWSISTPPKGKPAQLWMWSPLWSQRRQWKASRLQC